MGKLWQVLRLEKVRQSDGEVEQGNLGRLGGKTTRFTMGLLTEARALLFENNGELAASPLLDSTSGHEYDA